MNEIYCYNLAVRKSCRIINQFYESRLTDVGLKIGQFSILRTVYFCKQTTNSELQTKLVIDQTTLSRNLKPLLRQGLLKMNVDEADKRIKIISLSKNGKQKYLDALSIWQQAQIEVQNKMGQENSQKILELSEKIVTRLVS